MGSFEGADPEELDALSRQMNSAAATLEEIRDQVGSGFERLLWQGGDAEEFFDQWAHRFSGMVGAAVNALQSAAKQLGNEADQQREASGDGGESPAYLALDFTTELVSKVSDLTDLVSKDPASAIGNILPKGLDLDAVGDVLGPVAFGLGVIQLGVDYHENPDSEATADDEVGTALGLVGIGAGLAASAPLDVGVIAVGAVDEIVTQTIDPNLNKQIVHGVTDAAKFVVNADVDEVEGGIDAAEAAGSVVVSGVRGVSSLIGHL